MRANIFVYYIIWYECDTFTNSKKNWSSCIQKYSHSINHIMRLKYHSRKVCSIFTFHYGFRSLSIYIFIMMFIKNFSQMFVYLKFSTRLHNLVCVHIYFQINVNGIYSHLLIISFRFDYPILTLGRLHHPHCEWSIT